MCLLSTDPSNVYEYPITQLPNVSITNNPYATQLGGKSSYHVKNVKMITLGSRYPNSDIETPRYPNRGGGLGIRTKKGSRYPNYLPFCSDTETLGSKCCQKQ